MQKLVAQAPKTPMCVADLPAASALPGAPASALPGGGASATEITVAISKQQYDNMRRIHQCTTKIKCRGVLVLCGALVDPLEVSRCLSANLSPNGSGRRLEPKCRKHREMRMLRNRIARKHAQKRQAQARRGRELEKRSALTCLLYTSPSPRDATLSRMPSSA